MAGARKTSKAGKGSRAAQNTQERANLRNADDSEELDIDTEDAVEETDEQEQEEEEPEVEEAMAPKAKAAAKPGTYKKWLDDTYSWNGQHYGPSKYPGDLIEVPKDFPKHVGGKEPSPQEWKPRAESAVVEVPDESHKPL